MKLLIMCEGPNELEIIRILLENNKLKFTEDDLLGLTPYHARQISSNAQVRTALNIYSGQDVIVIRIGDKQNEKLKIPNVYQDKIIAVEKYCTKPELEMLLIIAENLVDEFEKNKSSKKPKEFAKEHICCGRKHYNNSTQFYREYFGNNVPLLVSSIKKYKQIHAHSKDEQYLADLLR